MPKLIKLHTLSVSTSLLHTHKAVQRVYTHKNKHGVNTCWEQIAEKALPAQRNNGLSPAAPGLEVERLTEAVISSLRIVTWDSRSGHGSNPGKLRKSCKSRFILLLNGHNYHLTQGAVTGAGVNIHPAGAGDPPDQGL